jgi:hypothetical protein
MWYGGDCLTEPDTELQLMSKKGGIFFASTLLVANLGGQGYKFHNADYVPSNWLHPADTHSKLGEPIEVSPSISSGSYGTLQFYNFSDAPVAAQWGVSSKHVKKGV